MARRSPAFTSRLTAVVATVLSLVAAPACGGARAQQEPATNQLVGVQMHPLWAGVTDRDAARELDIAKRNGADVVRIDIGWSTLELTGKGRIDREYSSRLDAFLRNARARRIKVIGTLMETPCWASRAPSSLRQGCRDRWWQRGVQRFPPRASRDYGDIAVYVARRWGGRLAALEIWNEPNKQDFLRSPEPAVDYGRLVRSSYSRVKQVRPRLTVLAGSLLHSDGDFLTALYERGHIAGHYDAISYHPYSLSPSAEESPLGRRYSLIAGTTWLHEVMTAHGDGDGELWATEAGASTCSPEANGECVSETEQAERVAAYLNVARRFPYVRAMVIYNLRNKGSDPSDIEQSYGLVRADLRPKPSLEAFRRAAGGE